MVPVMMVTVLELSRSAVSWVPAPYLKIALSPSLTAPGSTSVSAHAIVTNPSSASAAARSRQDCFAIVIAS